jgi:PKD repeat protein
MRKMTRLSAGLRKSAFRVAGAILPVVLTWALLLVVWQACAQAAGFKAQDHSHATPSAPPGTHTAMATPTPTRSPIATVEPCHSGTGWKWTYGPFQPELAAAVEGAMRDLGLETSVEARLYGETDSCGSFATYAVDFAITLHGQAPINEEEQQEIARRIYPVLEQFAKPQVGKLTIAFPATGDTLTLHGPPDANPRPSPTPLPALNDVGFHRRILVIVYDPFLSNGQLLHEYFGWFEHQDITQAHINQIYSASNGYVQYEVVATSLITDEWPVKIDGFRYTEEEYLAVIAGQSPPHEPDTVDYNAILNSPDLDICGRLNRGEIDDVWLYGGPYFGYWESTLAGPGGFWYNSPPVPDLNTCGRLVPIMGFNYERADGTGHIFGHRMESTMVRVYGDWEQNRTAHNWDRFGLVLAQSPDYWYSGCGSVHYPPNGTSDYDYSNPSTVPTTCYDFVNYPNLGDPQDTAQPVTCSAWNCDHADYMAWWHGHLPPNPGCGPDDVANNWWAYFAEPAHANHPLSACEPTALTIAGPALGEIDAALTFSATLAAITITPPITFFWQATGQAPATNVSGDLQDGVSYTWASSGIKAITVSAAYAGGEVTSSYTTVITSTHLATSAFTVTQGSDDAGPSPNCVYATSHNEIYFGKCANGQDITSGFRFANVTIPRHSRIFNAYLEFTVDGYYSNDLTVGLFGEATGDAQTFDYISRPEDRPLTDVSTTWAILSSDPWNMGEKRHTPDLSPVIQEVVSRADWDSGNALAVISTNTGPTDPPDTHRRVFAYERNGNGQEVAVLVVYYAEPALAADFSAIPLSGIAPLTVEFTDVSYGNITAWLWDFGDGTTASERNPAHTYTSVDQYTVTLTVSGPGGTDTLTRTNYITVYEPVDADFTADPTSGIAPLLVSFTNTSTGDYDACAWDFGDGATSGDCGDPVHTYTSADIYTVTLSVDGPGGTDTLTRTNYITVYEQVDAQFTASPTNGVLPLSVTFTNGSTGDYEACAWDFGDGTTSGDCEDPAHTYTTADIYTVTLTVSGPGGADTLTRTNYITVYEPYEPVDARFTAGPTGGIAPLLVSFTNTSTGDYDACAWDFGDGATSGDCDDPAHTYTTADIYTVTLMVSGAGGTDTLTRTNYITVYERVDAQFMADPTSGAPPLSVTFTNGSTGDYDACAWDFGDGATSGDCEDPAHTYTTADLYTVTLTVSGVGGTDTLTRTGYITVYEPVDAHFTAGPTSGIAPLLVSFTNTSTGDYDTCAWAFGDGAMSGDCEDPTHTYTSADIYTVTLMVTGLGGNDTLTRTNYITVQETHRSYLPMIIRTWSGPDLGSRGR